MTSLHVIENKTSTILRLLTLLEDYQNRTRVEIESDITLRGAVERYLYLAAQAAIDLAEATIAYKGYRKPATNRECCEILAENGVIGNELTAELAKMAGFRNLLAHAYERLDYAHVMDALQRAPHDLRNFTDAVRRNV